jgi:hypothetical protein
LNEQPIANKSRIAQLMDIAGVEFGYPMGDMTGVWSISPAASTRHCEGRHDSLKRTMMINPEIDARRIGACRLQPRRSVTVCAKRVLRSG